MPLPTRRPTHVRHPVRTPRVRTGAAALTAAIVVTTLVGAFGVADAGAARAPKAVVKIPAGEKVVVATGGGPDALPGEVATGAMAAIDGYLVNAAARPLQRGRPGEDARLAAVLSPAVMARLGGPDRAVLVDEGLPKATAPVRITTEPVVLTGLADASGKVVVVTAGLAATTRTRTAKGPVTITRTGDLVLQPDNGTWKIAGYSLAVDRVGKGLGSPTTTATTAPGAPGAPTPTTVPR